METLNGMIISLVDRFAEQAGRPRFIAGFADLEGTPLDPNDGLVRALAIAAPLQPKALQGIAEGPTQAFCEEATALQTLLNELADRVGEAIRAEGYQARALTDESLSSGDAKRVRDSWRSMKKIATRAAIGWVGKSGLLVTKHFGPAVLLAAVYTDAPLACSKETFLSRCARCRECLLNCPAGAISGTDWRPNENYDLIVDHERCFAKCQEISRARLGHEANACGICIAACPYTKAYLRRSL